MKTAKRLYAAEHSAPNPAAEAKILRQAAKIEKLPLSLVWQWLGFGFGWPLLLGLMYRDQTLGLRSDFPHQLLSTLESGGAKLVISFLLLNSSASFGYAQVTSDSLPSNVLLIATF